MAGVEALLSELGFGEYEARAYLALLGREPSNGYELAKLSGVPRGNIYAVLQKLEDRGAVVHMDTPAGARYAALPVPELLATLERRYQGTLAAAAEELMQVTVPPEADSVWNVDGYGRILDHARSLLAHTRERLLIALWPQEARALASELEAADKRGVAIGTLCLAGCTDECGACRGSIHRHRLSEDEATRSLVIVADDALSPSGGSPAGALLAAEIIPREPVAITVHAARGIRTRQRQLVDLAASYIRHSIALAAVLTDLGSRLADLVVPETRRALALLVQPGGQAGWLAGLRQMAPLSTAQDICSASVEPRPADRARDQEPG
jgi:HTH-type transcriptional regulator, sugar sensing transcriptional regulator